MRQARSAAALIQTHWHSKKVGDFARRAHEVLRTRLNSMARGFLWRKRLPLFNPAALYIQRCFRGYMSRLRIPIRNAAATVIQKYQRRRQLCPSLMRSWYLMKDWLIRLIRHRAFRLHMLNIKKAVCMCESAFLRYKPIRVKKDYKTQMINIQCWIRGLRVRFEMKRKQWAARTIQGVVKIFAAKHVLAQRRASGLLLGSAILMRYRRTQYKQALRRICKAQSAAKKLCARNKFHRMRACQIRIAAWYRGIAERQSVKEWLVARGRIIPVVTSFHVKRYAVPRFRRQLRAIVKMQSLARYLLALKRLERIFMAAAQIQVAMRGYLVRKDFLRKRRACLKLQSGRWMVAAVRRLAFMHVAAAQIQAGWRGYCGRHMVKTMRRLATRLVYRWQAILLERRTRHYLMLMQRFKIWLNTPTYRGLNATAIQTIWRRYSCEKRFQKQKVAVVKIQAVWRGTQVPTRSRRGAFNVRYLFSRPRVVVEDEEGRLTKLAPFGTQEADGPVHEIVDLPKLSKRQRRLLNQYMRSVLKFMGFIDDDM